jgi:hypothetical protein
MRPYEAHPFPRPTNLTVINGPFLTNFSPLGARFFGLHTLYAPFFNFNFAQLCFARLLCFFNLFFSLSRRFFASKFFARGRTFSCLSNFLFYYLSYLFFSCNRLLQFFICRRTLSLKFCLFQRGRTLSLKFCLFQRGRTFSRPSNFDRTEK